MILRDFTQGKPMSSINPSTYTFGDSVKAKLVELFASPDCTANYQPTPVLDATGAIIPGRTNWVVTVAGTLESPHDLMSSDLVVGAGTHD